MFDPNSTFMYIIVSVVLLFVLAQCVVFLRKALKRADELGIDKKKINRIMSSSAIFTIAPAVAILLSVIALSQSLGFPFPWLRLSVIGALTYETAAAAAAAEAVGYTLGSQLITDPSAFAAIAWVMTLGIATGLIWMPLFGKKVESGLASLKVKDKRWSEIFMTSLFLGMISAFLGVIFVDVSKGLVGFIPIFVMIAAALIMVLCAVLLKVTKARWINDYALPVSMLGGMALAIPITNLVQSFL